MPPNPHNLVPQMDEDLRTKLNRDRIGPLYMLFIDPILYILFLTPCHVLFHMRREAVMKTLIIYLIMTPTLLFYLLCCAHLYS